MLFNYTIKNWNDWGKVFQLIEDFTPLAREIFCREKLQFPNLEILTPGTNAVFCAGDYVLKNIRTEGIWVGFAGRLSQ